jgi:hypothetical protein
VRDDAELTLPSLTIAEIASLLEKFARAATTGDDRA